MLNLEEVKKRAKEGKQYSDWLYVWQLIDEVENLRKQIKSLKEDIVILKQGHY